MGTRLYVGNIPYTTTDADLRALFGQNGRQVTEVKIVSDRETGQSRGFAFVEMAKPDEAQAAIQELNGSAMGGRSIVVNEARERTPGGGGGAGGGFRGGGGRPGGGGGGGGGGYGGGGYGGGGRPPGAPGGGFGARPGGFGAGPGGPRPGGGPGGPGGGPPGAKDWKSDKTERRRTNRDRDRERERIRDEDDDY
jgi:RNA recognition motif-containing protein